MSTMRRSSNTGVSAAVRRYSKFGWKINSTGRFCFMCHYDIAYRGPDTRSANIAPKKVPFQTFSTYMYLVYRKTNRSRKTFFSTVYFRIVFWQGQERSRNSQTETTKILFYSMFCLLQTSDKRIFWYSRICSGYCRNLKKKKEKKLGG